MLRSGVQMAVGLALVLSGCGAASSHFDATQHAFGTPKACDGTSTAELLEKGARYKNGPVDDRDYRAALSAYACACNAGDSDGCNMAGYLRMNGWGAQRDLQGAKALFARSCGAGNGDGCGWLGTARYLAREITNADAFVLIRKGCEMGGKLACARVGGELVRGKHLGKVDHERARKLLARTCRAGVPYGCQMMAVLVQDQKESDEIVRSWYREGCQLGDSLCCYELGESLRWKSSDKKDWKSAVEAWEKGCAYGHADACDSLGEAHRLGEGVAEDRKKSARLYERACKFGSKDGCLNWGLAWVHGDAGPADVSKAFEPISRACDAGQGKACFWLGLEYMSGENVAQNVPRAVSSQYRACELGVAVACGNLLDMLDEGKELEVGAPVLLGILEKSCQMRNDWGCYELGIAYGYGVTVEKSGERAISYLRQGCSRGLADACNRMAIFLTATDSREAHAEAAALHTIACSGGDAFSCNELGYLYALGKGVDQDGSNAMQLFRKACDLKFADACDSVGEAFEKGWGTPVDLKQAEEMYQQACDMGTKEACERATRIRGEE